MVRSRVNEIDLLRFLAALAVVLFHYSFRGYAADSMSSMPYLQLAPFSKYGYLGVELFFIISGFVILMTAADGSLKNFIISRLIRLYPAFWACCTITLLVTILIGGVHYKASLSQYLINMTMLSGFFHVASVDGVYWSLFVEMKFYALVTLVLVFGKINQAQLFLMMWLIASIMLEVIPLDRLRYVLIVDYSAYFIAGAAYFLIWSQGVSLIKVGIILLSWCLALFQSINSLQTFEKQYTTNMNSYVVAGIVTAFFLVMLLVSLKRTGFLGRKRWLLIGALTYPLYLLHQFIGYMIFNLGYPAVNPHVLLWGTLIGIIGLAYAINIFVEKRFALPMKNALNNAADALQGLTHKTNITTK